MEHERISWHDNWHNEQEQQLQSSEENKFQSKLVRLLSSDSHIESGLCLAQLPKEYEKSYQEKVPNSKDYITSSKRMSKHQCDSECRY